MNNELKRIRTACSRLLRKHFDHHLLDSEIDMYSWPTSGPNPYPGGQNFIKQQAFCFVNEHTQECVLAVGKHMQFRKEFKPFMMLDKNIEILDIVEEAYDSD